MSAVLFPALRSAWVFLLALATLGFCCGQDSAINTWQQKSLPGGFSQMRTVPVVTNGYLLSFVRVAQSAPKDVFLMSLADGSQKNVAVQAKGVLTDVGMTMGGNVVFASLSASVSVDASSSAGPFNASVGGVGGLVGSADSSGNTMFLTDTGVYSPFRVCSSSDGSVWTLGQVLGNEPNPAAIQGDTTNLIRRYTIGGTLRSSYVPRNSLPAQPMNLAPSGSTFGKTVTGAFLSCGDTSAGAYIGRPFNTWIEVDYSTGQAQSWSVVPVPIKTGRLDGLVLLGTNKVYASFLMADGSNGLFQLILQGN